MKVLTIILATLLLYSCATVPDSAYRMPPQNITASNTPVYFVEIDDKGSFFDKKQLSVFLNDINKTESHLNIIVFIHGWHHNASPNDSNVIDFEKFVSQLSKYSTKKTVGLYVGWRGDSVKSIFDPILPQAFSDWFTIWGRKDTSELVGHKSIKIIINSIKDNIKTKDNTAAIIGHSLGGSVLLHAIKDSALQDALLTNKLSYIFLNPAISSKEYNLIGDDGFSGSPRKPLIITLQSNKDAAINWAFRIAYFSKPVGFNSSYITHDIWGCNDTDIQCLKMLRGKLKDNECAFSHNNGTWFIEARGGNGKNGGNGRRAPTCLHAGKRIDWVIDARHTVSASHNNILTDAEVGALAEILELKQK